MILINAEKHKPVEFAGLCLFICRDYFFVRVTVLDCTVRPY